MINFVGVLRKIKELKQKSQTLEIQKKELVSIIEDLKKENEAKNELISLFIDNYKIQAVINDFRSGEAFMHPIDLSSCVDDRIVSYFPLLKKMGYKISNEEIELTKEIVEAHDKLRNLKE